MRLKTVAVIGVGLLASGVTAGEKPALTTPKERASYAMALAVAKNIQRRGVDIDAGAFTAGLTDALSGGKLLMTEDEIRGTLAMLQTEVRQRQAEAAKRAADTGKKQGEAFLAENAKKKDVVTLPSGLQYRILKAGDGDRPRDGDTVRCAYRGTLVDGTEFDSSRRRGGSATLDIAKLIPGWREALKLMPVGSKWQLFIPPHLGYGQKGAGRKIAPNSTLVFDVELLAIQRSRASAAGEKTAGTTPAPGAQSN